ncbi:hypothetical protein [Exiguobacterium sp. B2(2022)]|uniref:hypothetical protein n=1 Tax=Exiguobacterium sp. B2(2022) TaxID=2992755 RepID=UPI00237B30F3|nr:hypothetical protein [Exiguobacterium sp. B2(2022)]MDE0562627.1 hypothetical protein [Exiguobacterium sp. B2(2022)]
MRQFKVTIHGQGDPVIFLPGGGFTGSQGQQFVEALHKQFEIHPRIGSSRTELHDN